jgi:hypothetical protein
MFPAVQLCWNKFVVIMSTSNTLFSWNLVPIILYALHTASLVSCEDSNVIGRDMSKTIYSTQINSENLYYTTAD